MEWIDRMEQYRTLMTPEAEGFTLVDRPRTDCRPATLEGTGYGQQIRTDLCVRLPDGRLRRVYRTRHPHIPGWEDWIRLDGRSVTIALAGSAYAAEHQRLKRQAAFNRVKAR